MIKKQINIICALMLVSFIVSACGGGSGSGDGSRTYAVQYNNNGADGGSVPNDTEYAQGATVTVPGNTGALVKTGFAFAGWNTRVDGNGDTYSGGMTFVMGETDVTLYAQWAASGTLDTTFDPGTGANDTIYSVAVQYSSDGDWPGERILIGGAFTDYYEDSYGNKRNNRIVRLLEDGRCDTRFYSAPGPNDTICSIAVTDYYTTILVGGVFSSYNEKSLNGIAHLNRGGFPYITSINQGTGVGGFAKIFSMAVQGDGKYVIAGHFSSYDGTPRYNIARLNADGSLDDGFYSADTDDRILSLAVQSDGKILIGGAFVIWGSPTRIHIARLNADGTHDTSFNPGDGVNSIVNSIAVQGDGKILIGGGFTNCGCTIVDGKLVGGTPRNRIARLNEDGSLDTTFDPGTGAEGPGEYHYIYSIVIQDDGKILIGGDFTSYNGTPRNRIARLNVDGSLDTTFDPGAGANNVVNSIAIQSDGKILIGGDFTSYNGTTRNRIARIWN